MKRKQLKTTRYMSLLMMSAILTLFVVALTAVSSVLSLAFYHWVGPNMADYTVTTVLNTLYQLILVGGGFLAGWLILRRTKFTIGERLVMSGALGLFASLSYMLIIDHVIRKLLPISRSTYLSGSLLGLLIGVAAAVVLAICIRSFSIYGRWLFMTLFIAVLLGSQVTEVFSTVMVGLGKVPGATLESYPVWLAVLAIITSPLVAGLVFYFLLRPIGRLTRLFYAAYLAALVSYVAYGVIQLAWGPEITIFNVLQAIGLSISTALMVGIAVYLLHLRHIR